jgi:hypothetical protein
MISDIVETQFPATPEGMAALLPLIAEFGFTGQPDQSELFVTVEGDDDDDKPVIGIVIYDPDFNYLADRICTALPGAQRLGYGPEQPATY